jgi:hypothetical protein
MLGLQFFFNVPLIELNAWEDEWFIIIEVLQEGKIKFLKNNQKRGDLSCGQYTNACKLNARWDGQNFKNHKSRSQQIFIFLIIKFPIFCVVQTCSKYGFWFQILHLVKDLLFLLNQLHVNHKLHVSQPIFIMYHTKVLKTLIFFCACYYFKMHYSHSSAFVFPLFIQQLNFKT